MQCGKSPNKHRMSCRCDRSTLIKGGAKFLNSGHTHLNTQFVAQLTLPLLRFGYSVTLHLGNSEEVTVNVMERNSHVTML
jgi:hypothetical protein